MRSGKFEDPIVLLPLPTTYDPSQFYLRNAANMFLECAYNPPQEFQERWTVR